MASNAFSSFSGRLFTSENNNPADLCNESNLIIPCRQMRGFTRLATHTKNPFPEDFEVTSSPRIELISTFHQSRYLKQKMAFTTTPCGSQCLQSFVNCQPLTGAPE
jgi:hypothetical protein